jgi:hypothetical protein
MVCRALNMFLSAGFAACLIGMAPALAKDATYCVTCKNPDQVYRCQVTGVGSRANDAVKLYCVVRLAKEGNHANCKAKRNIDSCQGTAKVFSYDGPAIPPEVASDPRVQGLVDKISREQDTFDKPKEGNAPKTMLEVGGRAVSASRKGWRNARDRLDGNSSEAIESSPAPSSPESHAETQNTPSAETMASEEDSSPNRMQRASSAVGGFARKSYRCMTSLFRNCGEQATE